MSRVDWAVLCGWVAGGVIGMVWTMALIQAVLWVLS